MQVHFDFYLGLRSFDCHRRFQVPGSIHGPLRPPPQEPTPLQLLIRYQLYRHLHRHHILTLKLQYQCMMDLALHYMVRRAASKSDPVFSRLKLERTAEEEETEEGVCKLW